MEYKIEYCFTEQGEIEYTFSIIISKEKSYEINLPSGKPLFDTFSDKTNIKEVLISNAEDSKSERIAGILDSIDYYKLQNYIKEEINKEAVRFSQIVNIEKNRIDEAAISILEIDKAKDELALISQKLEEAIGIFSGKQKEHLIEAKETISKHTNLLERATRLWQAINQYKKEFREDILNRIPENLENTLKLVKTGNVMAKKWARRAAVLSLASILLTLLFGYLSFKVQRNISGSNGDTIVAKEDSLDERKDSVIVKPPSNKDSCYIKFVTPENIDKGLSKLLYKNNNEVIEIMDGKYKKIMKGRYSLYYTDSIDTNKTGFVFKFNYSKSLVDCYPFFLHTDNKDLYDSVIVEKDTIILGFREYTRRFAANIDSIGGEKFGKGIGFKADLSNHSIKLNGKIFPQYLIPSQFISTRRPFYFTIYEPISQKYYIYFGHKQDIIEDCNNCLKGEIAFEIDLLKDELKNYIEGNSVYLLLGFLSEWENEDIKNLKLREDICIIRDNIDTYDNLKTKLEENYGSILRELKDLPLLIIRERNIPEDSTSIKRF